MNDSNTATGGEGCTVDWSWLEGQAIVRATSGLDRLVLTLSSGETLTVQAALWQGKPFLAFRFPPGRGVGT